MKAESPAQNEIHLWYQDLDRGTTELLVERHWDLLSPDEQQKFQTFKIEAKRREYLMTRAVVRHVLSKYAPVPPQDWIFSQTAYGCPEIQHPHLAQPLRFNLSHSGNLVVCAVGFQCELGVDVEYIKNGENLFEIAQSHFSRSEVESLSRLSGQAQIQRFYEYWTLKEAYIKARGMGLAIPIQNFSFELSDTQGSPIRILTGQNLDENPDAWRFKLLRPTEKHQLALAVRRPTDAEFIVVEKQANLGG